MQTITPPTQWLAGHVTRWHSGSSAPWLAHTQDRTCGHQGRMGVLALHYWPDCSREFLVACLCHDLGEYVAGDAPNTAKSDTRLRQALDRIEQETLDALGLSFKISRQDADRLTFLDRLDAYLWAQLHAPQIMDRQDWAEAKSNLIHMADTLGLQITETSL